MDDWVLFYSLRLFYRNKTAVSENDRKKLWNHSYEVEKERYPSPIRQEGTTLIEPPEGIVHESLPSNEMMFLVLSDREY